MATQLGSAFTPVVVHGWYGQSSATRIATPGSSVVNTLVKAGAGQVTNITVGNGAASARFLKLFDKSTAPVAGTDTPILTVIIEQSVAPVSLNFEPGLPFANGIGFAVTTGVADSDTGQPAANDVHGCIIWS